MSGLILCKKRLIQDLRGDYSQINQDLPYADTVVQVVCADDVAVFKDEVAFSLTALYPQNTRFSGHMQQLNYVDNRQVFQVSGKRHLSGSFLNRPFFGRR